MTARHRLQLSTVVAPEPIGRVLIASHGSAVVALDFGKPEDRLRRLLRGRFGDDVVLDEGDDQAAPASIRAYFDGDLRALDAVPIDTGGTPFQREVWATLRHIAPGETCAYGDLAARVGRPRAARAVGRANGLNPINLVVPCHRLVGADAALTGYGGGLARKRWLLEFERRVVAGTGASPAPASCSADTASPARKRTTRR